MIGSQGCHVGEFYRHILEIWQILKTFGYKYLVWRFGKFLVIF